MNNITPLIMCKNEESSIIYTLDSIYMFPKICVYDTGSTDSTIELITDFCLFNDIELRLLKGKFKDFSTSRNELFAYAESFPDVEWMLLMDSNDQLREGKVLSRYPLTGTAYHLTHIHDTEENGQSRYINVSLVKAGMGWYYKNLVHEYLVNDDPEQKILLLLPEQVILYQNRNRDLEKSRKRWVQDENLLSIKCENETDEMRRLYYLGQTCAGLSQAEKDPKQKRHYLKKAYSAFCDLSTKDNEFKEERFMAHQMSGDLSVSLELPWSISLNHYMNAFCTQTRVEPLLRVATHYYNKKNYNCAYMYSNFSMRLEKPKISITAQNDSLYDYMRWYLGARIFLELGKESVEYFGAGYEAIELAKKGALLHQLPQDDVNYLYGIYMQLKPKVDDQTITVREIEKDEYDANAKRCAEKKAFKETETEDK